MHACFWDDPSLPASSFLLRLADDPYPAAVALAYEVAWPRVQELFGDMIDDRVRDFGDSYASRIPAMFAKLCDGPLVLSHADWRLDNLFFTDDDDVIAVDWQLIDRSVGPRDLSYHVTQSVNIDDPAARATSTRSTPTSPTSTISASTSTGRGRGRCTATARCSGSSTRSSPPAR